jgi:transposase-like protein
MKKEEYNYVKRTQKDYSEAFKLRVVEEVERGQMSQGAARRKYGIQGHGTIKRWLEMYGNYDKPYKLVEKMEKSPEQKLLELEQKIKLLERKNKRLEKALESSDMKVAFFDSMINIAEKEFNIPIRKKSVIEQSKSSPKTKQ